MKTQAFKNRESADSKVAQRAKSLLHTHRDQLYRRTDRLFAGLMALQWLASLAAAYWIAPRTWEGLSSRPHPHLWIALFLGGAISLFPIVLALLYPGRVLTRHVIAVGQLLMSGLLIHLTGGHLETHFHVFGSLAFLAFYRDWRVLVTASLVTAADHVLRGLYWPQSIYGVAVVEPWHWVEHVAWVVFMDVFLIVSIAQSVREMRDIAWRQAGQEAAEAALQQAHDSLEMRVQTRTSELAQANSALQSDISERRRTEAALQESEQRLARAQSAAHLGYIEIDARTQQIYWSDETFRLLGYQPQEFAPTAQKFIGHVHAEDADTISQNLMALLTQSIASQMEYRVLRADGQMRWMYGQGEAICDAKGLPLRYVGTLLDITERRESEEALRASEQRHRSLMESLPDAVLVHCQGRLVYANAAALSLFGYERAEELVGAQTLSIIPPDFHPLVRERMRLTQEGQANDLVRLKITRSDGTSVDVETLSTPIVWQSQPGGQIIIRDITERVKIEQKLADLHALLVQRLDRIVVLNYELAQAYDDTIEGWSRALDLRDHETEGHSQRVTDMTVALARVFGMDEEEMVHVRRGALLHDIGKMGVPDSILLKHGPLTEEEWVVMRRHPVYAYEMLSEVSFVRPALEIPHCHHEKWDGTGYPRGLAGENIPLAARLFAVVDVWDALRSDRPYRSAWPIEKTRDHIASLAGTHFDPQVVSVFLNYVAPACVARCESAGKYLENLAGLSPN